MTAPIMIRLTPDERARITRLMALYGFRHMSDVVRHALRSLESQTANESQRVSEIQPPTY